MNPSSLVLRIDLCPDVVLRVPDPTHTTTDRPAEHAEAVGPFTNTTTTGLQKLPDVRVARESFKSAAGAFRASVEFDSGGATGGLIGRRGSHASGDCRHEASRTGRVVDELKERALEPSVTSLVLSAETEKQREHTLGEI